MHAPDVEIDIYEDVLLSELRNRISGRPSVKTLQRWVRTGIRSVSGARVKLETIKLPGGKGSSVVRYTEFLDRLQE
jgi:hypothetical protein